MIFLKNFVLSSGTSTGTVLRQVRTLLSLSQRKKSEHLPSEAFFTTQSTIEATATQEYKTKMPQPNLKSDDFYQVLGCPRNADENALKKAYRKLAVKVRCCNLFQWVDGKHWCRGRNYRQSYVGVFFKHIKIHTMLWYLHEYFY